MKDTFSRTLAAFVFLLGTAGLLEAQAPSLPIPPPAYPYQPHHSDAEFMTPERKAEFQNLRTYEVMVESFVDGDPAVGMGDGYGTSHHQGDLRGIIRSLDYIGSLGFNSLWITPFFDTKGTTKLDATGYYPYDYFAVDPHFGTLEDAKELVREAHARGIYVFLDGVFGHTRGGGPKPSPSGLVPLVETVNGRGKVIYSKKGQAVPESVRFFTEVAAYWIRELAIDGWRLDVANELSQDRRIFWEDIRRAVQDLCLDRARAGESWGVLGYMVGETWKSAREITSLTYGTEKNRGLWSNFDYPSRYNLVRVFATEESNYNQDDQGQASRLDEIFAIGQSYPAWAVPQLFVGNHDLVRFGDLIQRADNLRYGPENQDYFKRHKAVFNFLTAYTGPIAVYYGEEIGDELKAYAGGPDFFKAVKWTSATPADQWGVADDHVARTSGKVDGLNHTADPRQKDLKSYLSALMNLRAKHPALFRGSRTNLLAEEALYADLKSLGDEHILYLQNCGTKPQTLELALDDFETAQPLPPSAPTAPGRKGALWIFHLEGLEGQFYLLTPKTR